MAPEVAGQSGGLKVPKPAGSIAIASVIAAMLAVGYSAMLGFGVNETCDTHASSPSDCNRLNWMALIHVGTQIVLVMVAGLGGLFVWRTTSGWIRRALIAAVALVYACFVATAVVVYTDAAWDWANSRS